MNASKFKMALAAAGFEKTGNTAKTNTNTNNAWGFGGAITKVEEWAMDDITYWVGTKTLRYRHAPSNSYAVAYEGRRSLDFLTARPLSDEEVKTLIASVQPR